MGDLSKPTVILTTLALGLLGCGDSPRAESGSAGSATTAPTTATGTGTGTGTTAATGTGSGSASGSTSGPIFDVFSSVDIGGPAPTCKVVDDMDAVGDCGQEAPPDSFDPDVQWTFGPGTPIIVTPLVANLTDDNDDGAIDLCDTPDIVVVTDGLVGSIIVLDGATGQKHFQVDGLFSSSITPALGDIDNDGVPEIITATPSPHRLVAIENDGTVKWMGAGTWQTAQGGAIAIADMDNDGFPEIIADGLVSNNVGGVVFQAPEQQGWFFGQKNTAPVAADLDGDGDLELILGQTAYQHDGTEIWNRPEVEPGYPQVADLDEDGEPEILINNQSGITMLEADGTVKFKDLRPTGDPKGIGAWFRPSTVHDFDDDGVSEFAVSSAAHYAVYEPLPAPTPKWTASVIDESGWAAGTAFDFLGDGEAEAMYADEQNLYIFDGTGTPVLQVPRSSKTLTEYPVVADVDNDGSSEIVVVSSLGWDDTQTSPGVQVIRDAQDRWIQARRIWNQHTYHVTNVREDGTIPQFEKPHWKLLNTFRTNAQIEDGSVCKPPPAG